jgi:hypothetical protein
MVRSVGHPFGSTSVLSRSAQGAARAERPLRTATDGRRQFKQLLEAGLLLV